MKYPTLLYFTFLFSFFSCTHGVLQAEDQDPFLIYDEFWTFIDENYIFFELKNIDWDKERENALSKITPLTSADELFEICNQSLLALKDRHCRMSSPKRNHTPFNFTEGYEIHFSSEIIEKNYLSSEFQQSGYLKYGVLKDNIGYIHFQQMSRYGKFDEIIRDMKASGVQGLVIDVRNNAGGDSNPIPELLSDFVTEETPLGSYVEKSGPAHNDVTKPLPISTKPNPSFHFDLPVSMITNRKGYSATSYFTAMAKQVPSIKVVGQITGGGAGGNYGYQLSNGWVVAVSVSDFIEEGGGSIELGVEPDVFVENTLDDIQSGRDRMLEKAIEMLLD